MSTVFKNPICVSLDVSEVPLALSLAQELKAIVGGFKLGPRLLLKAPGLINKISALAPVFVDCKFFDIPSTMESAIQTCYDEGATLVTIHSLAGHEAMKQLANLEASLRCEREFQILAVSILTSWSEESYPPILKSGAPEEHVLKLAEYGRSCGIKGLVCSPLELSKVPTDQHYIVTPGIRRQSDSIGDQRRIMGPREAVAAGADLLVVGRPIIEAKSPSREAEAFVREVS